MQWPRSRHLPALLILLHIPVTRGDSGLGRRPCSLFLIKIFCFCLLYAKRDFLGLLTLGCLDHDKGVRVLPLLLRYFGVQLPMIESKHEVIFFGDPDMIDLGVVFPLICADIRIVLPAFLAL